jgi:hypothetical protein
MILQKINGKKQIIPAGIRERAAVVLFPDIEGKIMQLAECCMF